MAAETQLAKPKKKATANAPAYRRLTATDRAFILRFHAEGLTQTQIAQRIGCTQGAISQWLSQCEDSSKEASSYLKGSALRMAENIVKRGLPRDHVAALKGIRVLEDEQKSAPISLTINGLVLPGMTLSPSPMHSSGALVSESHQIPEQSALGSDNGDYVGTSAEAIPGAGFAGDPPPAGGG